MIKDKIEKILTGYDSLDPAVNKGLHSWRCQYPAQYGACNHSTSLIKDLADAFDKAHAQRLSRLAKRVRAARAEAVEGMLIGEPSDDRGWQMRLQAFDDALVLIDEEMLRA